MQNQVLHFTCSWEVSGTPQMHLGGIPGTPHNHFFRAGARPEMHHLILQGELAQCKTKCCISRALRRSLGPLQCTLGSPWHLSQPHFRGQRQPRNAPLDFARRARPMQNQVVHFICSREVSGIREMHFGGDPWRSSKPLFRGRRQPRNAPLDFAKRARPMQKQVVHCTCSWEVSRLLRCT